MTQIQDLQNFVKDFQRARGWEVFTPENTARALLVEAAELQELFLWKDGEGSFDFVKKNHEEVADEVADIFAYLLTFCDVTEIDLEKALCHKMAKNELRFSKK